MAERLRLEPFPCDPHHDHDYRAGWLMLGDEVVAWLSPVAPEKWARIEAALATLPDDDPRHVVDLRGDGWTIKHPLACRPHLFDCPVNKAAEHGLRTRPPVPDGQYVCSVGDTGGLIVGGRVDGDG